MTSTKGMPNERAKPLANDTPTSKEPIKPGESGEIKVTYNGKNRRAGEFEKTITIRANTKAKIHRLKVKGSMIVQ